MAKKAPRLRFTEEELTDPKVKRAVSRAERASDKAEHAARKIRKKRHPVSGTTTERKTKLSFQKQGGKAARAVTNTVSKKLHSQVAKNNQDNNTAVEAANTAAEGTETGFCTVNHAVYSKKLKAYQKAAELQAKADTANVEAIFQRRMAEHPEAFSNPISRMKQNPAGIRCRKACGTGGGKERFSRKGRRDRGKVHFPETFGAERQGYRVYR